MEAIDALLSDGDVEENHLSSSWMAVVDRSGLLHISDDLYRAMELEIQKHLRINKVSEMVSSLEGKLVSILLANEDVQFIGVLCVGRFQKGRL